MNTMRPGSFGMRDGKLGILTPEEQKELEARNKKFVKVSIFYWLCAFLVLVLAFVILVLVAPSEEGNPNSYLSMILLPFGWMGAAGLGYAIVYWGLLGKKPKAEKKENKDPWE